MEIAYGVIVSKNYYIRQVSIHNYGKIDLKRLALDTWRDIKNDDELDPEDIQRIIEIYGDETGIEKFIREKPEKFLPDIWPSIPGIETMMLASGKLFVGFLNAWGSNVPGRIGMTKEDINRVDNILAEYGLDQEEPNVYIGTDLQNSIDNPTIMERLE